MRNPLELLIGGDSETDRRTTQSFRWATVTDSEPLRIRLDSDTEPIAATPLTLVGSLSAGDRVFVLRMGRRTVILGRGGGGVVPPSGPFAQAADVYPTGASPTAVGEEQTFFIPLPEGRFTVPPIVTISHAGSFGRAIASHDGVTTSMFRVIVVRNTRSWANGSIHWTAVQMTDTSAGG